ncbi:hypothetical protein HDU81_010739, partial [Chytriomyces hyalinus]
MTTNRPLPETVFLDPGTEIDNRVLELYHATQYNQRTEGWYAARKNCITTSSAAALLPRNLTACEEYRNLFELQETFKLNPEKSCAYKETAETFMKIKAGILVSEFSGNVFTEWGVKYEPVVTTIYSQLQQVDMLDFGLLIHPKYPFLGASPDGISTKGVMLEIKCPPVRKVSPIPSLYYYIQMLLQLECTGLSECDFFDAHFVQYVHLQDWIDAAVEWEHANADASHHIFGLFVNTGSESEPEYRYLPDAALRLRVQSLSMKGDKLMEALEEFAAKVTVLLGKGAVDALSGNANSSVSNTTTNSSNANSSVSDTATNSSNGKGKGNWQTILTDHYGSAFNVELVKEKRDQKRLGQSVLNNIVKTFQTDNKISSNHIPKDHQDYFVKYFREACLSGGVKRPNGNITRVLGGSKASAFANVLITQVFEPSASPPEPPLTVNPVNQPFDEEVFAEIAKSNVHVLHKLLTTCKSTRNWCHNRYIVAKILRANPSLWEEALLCGYTSIAQLLVDSGCHSPWTKKDLLVAIRHGRQGLATFLKAHLTKHSETKLIPTLQEFMQLVHLQKCYSFLVQGCNELVVQKPSPLVLAFRIGLTPNLASVIEETSESVFHQLRAYFAHANRQQIVRLDLAIASYLGSLRLFSERVENDAEDQK